MRKRPLEILLVILLLASSNAASAGMQASFRFPLSNFTGPVPSQWAKLAVDLEHDEIYALNPRGNDIRIFDSHGMETFVFGDGYASAKDIAIGRHGDIWILSSGYQSSTVHLLDFRGEHVAEMELKNVPTRFSGFVADRLVYKDRSLYLVDSDALLVIAVDEKGYFKHGHDLNAAVKPSISREKREREIENYDWREKQLENIELNGFTVDDHGNLYFTVPVLFSAFVLSPQGDVRTFGKPGSAPGKFGVTAGIAVDQEGYIYVADRLRSVVLVFDRNLRFQGEFGYRGDRPSNLIVPDDVAIGRNGNVYVGQAANRGVSVFRVELEAVESSQGSATPVRPHGFKKTRSSRVERKARTSRASRKARPSRTRERKKSLAPELGPTPAPTEQGQRSEQTLRPEKTIREEVSEPVEFVVDRGADAPAEPDEPEWTLIESDPPADPSDDE